jgi:hypothetical protein
MAGVNTSTYQRLRGKNFARVDGNQSQHSVNAKAFCRPVAMIACDKILPTVRVGSMTNDGHDAVGAPA